MPRTPLNLLGNTVNFTEPSNVTVILNPAHLRNTVRADEVQVRATSIGLVRHKLEEIFEAFTQVDISATRKVGGPGWGFLSAARLPPCMAAAVGRKRWVGLWRHPCSGTAVQTGWQSMISGIALNQTPQSSSPVVQYCSPGESFNLL